MTQKKSAKKKAGRPATGRDPAISARVPESVVEAIDAWAEAAGTTRSDAIAKLIGLGVNAPAAKYPREILTVARNKRSNALKLNAAKKINERYLAAAQSAHNGGKPHVQADIQKLGDLLRFTHEPHDTKVFLDEVRRHLRSLVGL